jgi:hypothetical protein
MQITGTNREKPLIKMRTTRRRSPEQERSDHQERVSHTDDEKKNPLGREKTKRGKTWKKEEMTKGQ